MFRFSLFAAVAVVVVALIMLVLARPTTPSLSEAEVSGTMEAVQVATSQAEGRATARAGRASGTARARATTMAEARERGAIATQAALATAEAPPTLTAEARAYETARVQAEATAQVLEEQAILVYGLTTGTLEQMEGDEVPCAAAGVNLRDFVAEVTFRNPQAAGAEADRAWDYGLVFSNIGEGTEYRAILDSGGSWTFGLHSEDYDISISDATGLVDLSGAGSNTLKLFVTGDEAQLYVNGSYIDTFDLTMLALGQSSEAAHDVMVCAGLGERYRGVGMVTQYEEFKVWFLP
ncbi:MAG TPA: hypothetical protein VFH60_09500 [Chloroflexia bacterium]|nr:hypothetical protein [Chloroflexia bacterium]